MKSRSGESVYKRIYRIEGKELHASTGPADSQHGAIVIPAQGLEADVAGILRGRFAVQVISARYLQIVLLYMCAEDGNGIG